MKATIHHPDGIKKKTVHVQNINQLRHHGTESIMLVMVDTEDGTFRLKDKELRHELFPDYTLTINEPEFD